MSAGHGTRVASTPPLTVSGVGPPRTLTGREAAIVWAVLEALRDPFFPHAELYSITVHGSPRAVDWEYALKRRKPR